MKLKNKLVFWLFLTLVFNGFSQEEKKEIEPQKKQKSEFWKKVTFGGGLGLNFSNSITTVSASPNAVYNFNQKFSLGTGINIGYTSFSRGDVKQFNYGASILGLYNPFNGLQLSSEFEYLFVNRTLDTSDGKIKSNFNFPAFYLGAGYRYHNIVACFRYDILFNENKSIYDSALSPFLRVSF